MVDFIGVGAQKSGTSWVYACLYEHPEICAPIKEIHFFSRPRFEKGIAWYESHFKKCSTQSKKGEFSTSYLYAVEAPARIKAVYPDVKIIAILRDPTTRAYSQYRNALKAGEITETTPFLSYIAEEKSVIAQGMYAEQLARYVSLFGHEHMLVLVYEDIARDPRAFMQRIYAFLDVDVSFVPSMLYTSVNTARMPKRVYIDRMMHHLAEFLRRIGLDRFVWYVRKIGLPDMVRAVNTKAVATEKTLQYDRDALARIFREDARRLTEYCGRDMVKEWNLE